MSEFKVGEKVIWKPIDYRDGSENTNHIWFGSKCTVIQTDSLNQVCISVDDFPQTNHRSFHNRFWANSKELKKVE